MEKRKYIVLLAAVLLVIGAPSLLFAAGGIPNATKESFRVGEQNCQLNVAFDQLGDQLLAWTATTLGSADDGIRCDVFCGEGPCENFCFVPGDDDRLATARLSDGPSWCNSGSIDETNFDQTVVCEKNNCKPNKKGGYDCTKAYENKKCEQRQLLHRRTAERLGNNTQICVTDRLGRRVCLGTP